MLFAQKMTNCYIQGHSAIVHFNSDNVVDHGELLYHITTLNSSLI